MKKIAILTCPECGHKQPTNIPEDRCIPFYKCRMCGKMIKAQNRCCVICEYSDAECPVAHEHPRKR